MERREKEETAEKLKQLDKLLKRCSELETKANENTGAHLVLQGLIDNRMVAVDENEVWTVPSGLNQSMHFNPAEQSQSQDQQQQHTSLMND